MTYRITHINAAGERHRFDLADTTPAAAQAIAEAMYGPAFIFAAICLRGQP